MSHTPPSHNVVLQALIQKSVRSSIVLGRGAVHAQVATGAFEGSSCVDPS